MSHRILPAEPTPETISTAVQCALNAVLGEAYTWQDYMRDLYRIFTATAPDPLEDEGLRKRVADAISWQMCQDENSDDDLARAAIAAMKGE